MLQPSPGPRTTWPTWRRRLHAMRQACSPQLGPYPVTPRNALNFKPRPACLTARRHPISWPSIIRDQRPLVFPPSRPVPMAWRDPRMMSASDKVNLKAGNIGYFDFILSTSSFPRQSQPWGGWLTYPAIIRRIVVLIRLFDDCIPPRCPSLLAPVLPFVSQVLRTKHYPFLLTLAWACHHHFH